MLIACHCEGKGWKFWGDSNLRSKFWGRSIQLDPVGTLTLEFDDGEVFQWNKVCFSQLTMLVSQLPWSYPELYSLIVFIQRYQFPDPSQVTTTIYNLILGKVYCDHHGTMNIRGNSQYSCKLKFKEQSLLDRNPRQVRKSFSFGTNDEVFLVRVLTVSCRCKALLKIVRELKLLP